MKIFINGLSAKFGGGELYLRKILENLQNEDFDITLYCPHNFPVPDKKQITKVVRSSKLSRPLRRFYWEKFVLPKILASEKYRVLFCPGGTSATDVPASCKQVITFQNMLPFSPATLKLYGISTFRLKMILLKRAMLKGFRSSQLCIFISNYAKDVVHSYVGANLKSQVTIYHGVETVNVTETTHPLNENEYLLYVSVLTPYKNQIPVIKAFSKFVNINNYAGHLVLVGKDDTIYGKNSKQLVKELGMEKRIHFTGNLNESEVNRHYQHASGFIFASECENCPNILLEMLKYKKPLAVSQLGPMDELAFENVNYFNPRNPQSIYLALNEMSKCRLLPNTSLLYSWEEAAERTWSAIKNLN